MTEPITAFRRGEIQALHADYRERHNHRGAFACCSAHPVADAVPELLSENARLREALKTVKLRTVQRDLSRLAHTALYGTKKKGETRG